MSNIEIVIMLCSSSTGTVIVTEGIKSLRRFIRKRKGKGISQIESDIAEIKLTNERIEKSQNEMKKELDDSKETERVILHDRIWQSFRFFSDKDEISVEDRANIDYLYAEYKKKKGNHKAQIMYEYIKTIPVIPETTEEGELRNGMDN